jgi:hypothetical protein
LSHQQIELSYERGRPPWYRKRWVQRWAVFAAILIAGAWAVDATRPIWPRYRYYRMQQQATTYIVGPSRVLVTYSATQPYNHISGPADRFLSAFQKAQDDAGLSQVSLGPAPGGITPIFCGLRTTKGGSNQIVRVFSAVFTSVSQSQFWIAVLISDWRPASWVFSGRPGRGDPDMGFGEFVGCCGSTDSVTVLGGSANLHDPSEVDIPVVINGQPTTIQFHVTEVSKPSAAICVAVDQAAVGRAFVKLRACSFMHLWDLPFTGK